MKVSLLGYGTVGVGVYEMLCASNSLEEGCVLVREGKDALPFMRTSIHEIVDDTSVSAVAEAMGGIEPAYSYLVSAIEAGKHIVTANKALVCEKGLALTQLAHKKGVGFLFSAACGGGVPFLSTLAIARESDKILSLNGILNGTTNFILDSMQRMGKSYAEALKEAQRLGYAEADPTADVSGLDALRKLILACAVGFNVMPVSGIEREGIENFTLADAQIIQSLGFVCRLTVNAVMTDKGLSAWVQPTLFSDKDMEAHIYSNNNLARYRGKNAGDIVLMGQGAGRYPTASAVLRDLNSLASAPLMLKPTCQKGEAHNEKVYLPFFVRVSAPFASRFSSNERNIQGDTAWLITPTMGVSQMHKLANDIRSEGGKIFFAAMGEKA